VVQNITQIILFHKNPSKCFLYRGEVNYALFLILTLNPALRKTGGKVFLPKSEDNHNGKQDDHISGALKKNTAFVIL
jgi:hypothetical protein